MPIDGFYYVNITLTRILIFCGCLLLESLMGVPFLQVVIDVNSSLSIDMNLYGRVLASILPFLYIVNGSVLANDVFQQNGKS